MGAGTIFLGIIVIAVVLGIAIYNKLVSLQNLHKTLFSQIDVQLKRRHDLIPNIVETAKGYLKHERETLEGVMAARNGASQALAALAASPGSADLAKQLGQAESQLSRSLGGLNVVVEAYPELKADQNMMQVSQELTEAENRISGARRNYNESVMQYNVYRQSFPNNIVANIFGHNTDAALLEFEDREAIQKAPEVKF